MKILSKTVSLIALSVTLAACGGGASEADDPTGTLADDVAAPAEAPVDGEPAAGETDAATDVATGDEAPADEPSPTPTATATTAAATPAARPAAAAAATPPPMYAVCAACHAVEPGNHGIGPSLAGVFGASAGHASGFEYSSAMLESGLTWDEATLHRYLENPRQVVPGTTMAYNGMRNDTQRQAIIDYLKGL